MDGDVAYLLGMIFAHGKLIADPSGVRRLVIDLPIRQDRPRMPRGFRLPDMNIAAENERALTCARRRINELLEVNVDLTTSANRKTATLTAVFTKRTVAWRDIECLCSGGMDRKNFYLPGFFFDFPPEIHKHFVQGFADAASTPGTGDYMPSGRGKVYRIAFPVVYDNLRFARQLKKLFEKLGIRAGLLSGDPKKRGGKPREHRIRMRAEEYLAIGFSDCFKHKNLLLNALASANRKPKRNAPKKK